MSMLGVSSMFERVLAQGYGELDWMSVLESYRKTYYGVS